MSNKVLIIDDEKVITDLTRKVLSSESYAVDVALDGQTGLEKLQTNAYGLVLCDIMMPDVDGFAVLDEIKRLGLAIPVIMITGYSTVETAMRSINADAFDFLPKPFTYDELVSYVRRGFRFGEMKSAKLPEISYPAGYYLLGHLSWVHKSAEGLITIGMTETYLHTIDHPSQIEFHQVDEYITQGKNCINIFTDDETPHALTAPLSGKIMEVNENLNENLSALCDDPYGDGWIYRIIPSSLDLDLKYLRQT